uniref:Uncharacterized protein n=1 Tax=Populus davidiana TaxID=266767 RepID=A0A6M2EMB7_9ROSI
MWAASVVAVVEMGKGETTPESKLGGAAVVFNRKREASAEGRRPGRRRSCGLIWVKAWCWSEGRRKEISSRSCCARAEALVLKDLGRVRVRYGVQTISAFWSGED